MLMNNFTPGNSQADFCSFSQKLNYLCGCGEQVGGVFTFGYFFAFLLSDLPSLGSGIFSITDVFYYFGLGFQDYSLDHF